MLVGASHAVVFRGSHEVTLLTDMRPDLAAKLLLGVENRWTREAQSLLSGHSMKLEGEVHYDVVKSCTKIANSIVRGSDGETEKVQEYMNDVCAATESKEDNELCLKFQDGVQGFMSADTEFDRDELDMSKFCEKFYAGTVKKVAAERLEADKKKAAENAKAEAEKKAEEKKAAEEAAKKALKENAEKAVRKAKESLQAYESAEKAADELTTANAKEEQAEEKLMEAQDREAESMKQKARQEMVRAAAVEAAEKAKAEAETAFEKEAEEKAVEAKAAQKKKVAEAAGGPKKAEGKKKALAQKKVAIAPKKVAVATHKKAVAKKKVGKSKVRMVPGVNGPRRLTRKQAAKNEVAQKPEEVAKKVEAPVAKKEVAKKEVVTKKH